MWPDIYEPWEYNCILVECMKTVGFCQSCLKFKYCIYLFVDKERVAGTYLTIITTEGQENFSLFPHENQLYHVNKLKRHWTSEFDELKLIKWLQVVLERRSELKTCNFYERSQSFSISFGIDQEINPYKELINNLV